MCFSKEDVQLFDNLMWLLEINNTYQSLWSDQCDYIKLGSCTHLNLTNKNLITLQLNIWSLLSHQSELNNLIAKLEQ